jgi:hypothetical protein
MGLPALRQTREYDVDNKLRLEIERREPFAGGVEFDGTGPYERLFGKAHFAIDPEEADLPYICDLELAPRNTDGLVEFSCVVDIVKPVDLSKGSHKVLSATATAWAWT